MRAQYRTNFILFILFALSLVIAELCGLNKTLFLDINSFAAHNLPLLWPNLTLLGDTMTLFAIILLFIRKRADLVISAIIAVLIGTIIVNLLKTTSGMLRPAAVLNHELINIIGPVLTRHSFPSGHTISIFTLAGIIIFSVKQIPLRLAIFLIALLTGISRIAVGAHWPEDVLAGAAIGLLSATVGVYLSAKLKWSQIKAVPIVLGLLLIFSDLFFLFFYNYP